MEQTVLQSWQCISTSAKSFCTRKWLSSLDSSTILVTTVITVVYKHFPQSRRNRPTVDSPRHGSASPQQQSQNQGHSQSPDQVWIDVHVCVIVSAKGHLPSQIFIHPSVFNNPCFKGAPHVKEIEITDWV